MRKLAFSLPLLAASALAGTTESHSAQASGIPVDDAATLANNADSSADPASVRLDEIDEEYHARIVQTLSDSVDPRDWALASLIAGSNKEPAASLSARAAASAPNDALVQWIALSLSDRTASSSGPGELALSRLQSMEPNNASVWLRTLMRASSRHDTAAVDDAMHRMATSVRVDECLYDVQKALLAIFRRNPLPDRYFTIAAGIKPNPVTGMLSRESAPYVASVAIVVAMPFPAYQTVVNACRSRADFRPSAARIDDCARIGRLMATKGNTLIANRIGSTLLRVTRTYTADDMKLARTQGWVYEKFIGLYADTDHLPSATKLIARMDDQDAAGSEVEAMRRELVRENLPTEPPADWTDARSLFSAERLHDDEVALSTQSK